MMSLKLDHHHHHLKPLRHSRLSSKLFAPPATVKLLKSNGVCLRSPSSSSSSSTVTVSASSPPLDLTEENIKQALSDARTELAQLFDAPVNITGKAEVGDLDGTYVKIRLSGRFWHKRSMVLARLGNYLKQRIPARYIAFPVDVLKCDYYCNRRTFSD